MQLYHSLPATNYAWASASIESMKQLRGAKQGAFNHIVGARVELVRLVVFSAIECGVHLVAAGLKFTAAVVTLPTYPFFGGISPRVALVDTSSHIFRAVKLVVATPFGVLLGLAQPEWSAALYQKFSLVDAPEGLFADAMGRISSALTTAWASPHRTPALKAAAVTAALIGGYWLPLPSRDSALWPEFIWPVVGGGALLCGLTASCCWARTPKVARPPRQPQPAAAAQVEREVYPVWVKGSHSGGDQIEAVGAQNGIYMEAINVLFDRVAAEVTANSADYLTNDKPAGYEDFKAAFVVAMITVAETAQKNKLYDEREGIKQKLNQLLAGDARSGPMCVTLFKDLISELRICSAANYQLFIGTMERGGPDAASIAYDLLAHSRKRSEMLPSLIGHLMQLIQNRTLTLGEVVEIWTPILIESSTENSDADREQTAVWQFLSSAMNGGLRSDIGELFQPENVASPRRRRLSADACGEGGIGKLEMKRSASS